MEITNNIIKTPIEILPSLDNITNKMIRNGREKLVYVLALFYRIIPNTGSIPNA